MKQTSLGEKIVRANITEIIKFFLIFPISFLLTPLFVRYLGVENYGVYILIGSWIAYIKLSELNIGQTSVKYIAEYSAREDFKTINKILNTSFIVYAVIALLVFILFLFTMDWLITKFFPVPANMIHIAKFIFVLGLATFGFELLFSPFYSILWGLQRLDIKNILETIFSWLWLLVAFLVLVKGFGLKGVAIAAFCFAFLRHTVILFIVKWVFPKMRWNLFLADFKIFKKILHFSLKMLTTNLATLARIHANIIILSYFLGLVYVTYYQIGFKLVNYIEQIPLLIIFPIMPAASELYAKGDKTRLKTLYLRSTKYVETIALPIALGLLIFGQRFISLWLGPGFEKSLMVVIYLSIAYLFTTIMFIPSNILYGIGKVNIIMFTSMLYVFLNVFLSILLVMRYGYIGAIYGFFIANIIDTICVIVLFHKVTNFSFSEMIRTAVIKPLCAGLIVGSIILFSFLLYQHQNTWTDLICRISLFMALYILALRVIKHFDAFDKEILQSYIPRSILCLFTG